MIYSNKKNGLQIEFPEWEESTELRWLNGVPFGGARTDAKEVYMEQMMEYDRATKTCPDCDGSGEVDEEIKESFASDRISPRYKKVKCETCDGEGRIEE